MVLLASSISNGGYVASVATWIVRPPRSGTCEAGLAGAAGCWACGRWQPTAMSATTTSTVATHHLRLTIPIHLPGSLWEHRECFSRGQGTPLPSPERGVERDAPRAPRNSSSTATRLEGRDELEPSYETPGDTRHHPGRRAAVGTGRVCRCAHRQDLLGRKSLRQGRWDTCLRPGRRRSDARPGRRHRWLFREQCF